LSTVAKVIIIAIVSYLLGGLNFSIIVSKKVHSADVRKSGSGNAGLTNFYRTMGKHGAIWVILGDMLKCLPPVIIGFTMLGKLGMLWAGLCTMLGHAFPVYFGFKGGKGVLVAEALAFYYDWRIGLACMVMFAVVLIISRYVSLGSIVGSSLLPFLVYMFDKNSILAIAALLVPLSIYIMHSANVERILMGQEHKISFSRKKNKPQQNA